MKKFLFGVMAMVAIGFTACNNKAQQGEATDSTEVTINVDDEANATISALTEQIEAKDATKLQEVLASIKDKIAELLFELFSEKILPMLVDYNLLIMRERMDAWIALLSSALRCLSLFRFNRELGSIDDVDYADIIKDQNRPESKNEC